MGVQMWIEGPPAVRQVTGRDPLGREAAAKRTAAGRRGRGPEDADQMVKSVPVLRGGGRILGAS
jgi:formate dehydrogenase major subunit